MSRRAASRGGGWLVVLLIAVGALSTVAGQAGPLLALGAGFLLLVLVLNSAGDRERIAVRPSLIGMVLLGTGLPALFLGRVELVSLAVVAGVVDVLIGRHRVRSVELRGRTVRDALADDEVALELTARGVRGPVQVAMQVLGEPGHHLAGPPRQLRGDTTGSLRYRWRHRGVYRHAFATVSSSGWLASVVTTRLVPVSLDAPVIVHPRPCKVPVEVVLDADDGDGEGVVRVRRGPEAQEVRSLRPYVPGDPPRRVHWPTTARRGELAVVEVDGEAQTVAHIAVQLPAHPCAVDHPGSHASHLDVITGEARWTVETLLRARVPVVLTTVEADEDGEPHTVSERIAGSTEAGRRLARAHAGEPELPRGTSVWVHGPRSGPAKRTTEPAADAGPAPTPMHPPREARREQHPEGDVPTPGRNGAVVLAALGPLMAGVLVARTAPQPGSWVPPAVALLVAAGVVGTTAFALRCVDRRGAVVLAALGTVTFLGMLAAMAATSPPAWIIAALLLSLLQRAAGQLESIDRRGAPHDAYPRHRTAMCLAAVAVAAVVGVIALVGTQQPTVAIGVGAALVPVALVWSTRPTWWSASGSAIIAGLVVGAVAPSARAAMLVLVVAALAWMLVVDHASGEVATLDGRPPSRPVMPLLGKLAVAAALVVALSPVIGAAHARWDGGLGGDTLAQGGDSGTAIPARQDLDLARGWPSGAGTRRVVLTVEADAPALLRMQTMDRWDGRYWTREHADAGTTVATSTAVGRGPDRARPVSTATHASGPVAPELFEQRITVRSRSAEVLPTASEPVDVDGDARVVEHADGLRRVVGTFRRGDRHTVWSIRAEASEEELSRAGTASIPDAIRRQYAASGGLSTRAVAAIEAATADSVGTYEQARAIETWLADQVTYSLDAPPPPPGADVVDHFLFESRQGWCQHLATTMTLALRELGAPARVAVGYVATEWDGRRYVVRDEHAHAWTELYLPGIGWYAIDPLVPLADPAPPASSAVPNPPSWLVLPLAVGLGGVLLVAGLVAVHRRRARAVELRPIDPRPWASAAGAAIRELADRCNLRRGPGGGVAEDAASLASTLGDERIVEVGRLVLRDAYGPEPVTDGQRAWADGLLVSIRQSVDQREAATSHVWSAGQPVGSGGSEQPGG